MIKGSWSGSQAIESALNTGCSSILGGLAGYQLAGVATTAVPASSVGIPLWIAPLADAGVLAILEGVSLLFVDCDGWVVKATMLIGRVELD